MTAARPRGETRERILSAARTRFLRFGPQKTTMDDVAREAGCSRAAVYLHFSSKRDLYARLLERAIDALLANAESVFEARGSFFEKFRRLGRLWVDAYKSDPILDLALGHDPEMTLDPVARPVIQEQQRRMVGICARILQEGVESGYLRPIDPEHYVYLMIHLMGLLIERELAQRSDHPYHEMMDLTGFIFARAMMKPSPEASSPPT